ncbi:O-phosphoseryl-tRNA(Sec) selenium transferase [Candidatus Thorarchaeota archaeon]|nr:MAG: O-phosphoseryl-tRNA(Sec) selenium transferase [Candidatus Thorarchaeota archaeon]
MDPEEIDRILDKTIPESMARRGRTTIDAFLAPVRDALNRRVFPEKPMTDSQLEIMFKILSSMDTDKDPEAARVGEREARVYSSYVERLSAGFNHGVGRSGQLNEPQPKAVGSSVMQQLANTVALDAIKKLGLSNIRTGLVTPLSTGMSLALVLGGLRRELGIRKILYPRIDHKSPQRGISFTGIEEIIIPTLLEEDAVQVDIGALESAISKTPSCGVLATTTFFPPRESDPVKQIAKMCGEHDVPLVINNAYGVQSQSIMDHIRSAIDAGRVDAIVQSSDKNFLAPVGGSIIVSPNPQIIEWASDTYAGRASAAPIAQTLAALLALGLNNYNALQQQQLENIALLKEKMHQFSESIGQRVLQVENPIACAITMDNIDVRELGARLYNERVTGPRAVEKGSYGSSIDNYPHSYLVMNAAIGARKIDIENATTKLYKQASTLIKSP